MIRVAILTVRRGGDGRARRADRAELHRLIVTRVPVLIGAGIPHFGETGRDIVLTYVATRTLAGGLVQSEYAVGAR